MLRLRDPNQEEYIKTIILEPARRIQKDSYPYELKEKAVNYIWKNPKILKMIEWAKQDFIQTDEEAVAIYLILTGQAEQ